MLCIGMVTAPGELYLLCDALRNEYTLSVQGGAWREDFQSLDAALERAAAMIETETTLNLYNELGKHLLATTLLPMLRSEVPPRAPTAPARAVRTR
jgi:hypothetical protein